MGPTQIRLSSIAALCLAAGCGGGGTTPTEPSPGSSAPTSVTVAINQAYSQAFGEEIVRPAIVNASGCNPPHITSTAYLGPFGKSSTLLTLYTSLDGLSASKQTRANFLTPAGVFEVLVVVVKYPETIGDGVMGLLENAERDVNEDHASFARARGYSAPLVVFNNTNVLVDVSAIINFRTLSGVTMALSQQGRSVTGYDFVAAINIDPTRSEGGFATPGSVPGFIYMGNFSRWQTALTGANVTSIAGAVYHHEVIHHWGWPGTHDWACGGGYEFNFRVPSVLLGWEDVDGDAVPEILDQTPYGRSRR